MVTPDAKRAVVAFFQAEHGMKELQACRVAGVCRGTVRYEPRPDRNIALRRALRRLAGKHRRYGVRRLCILLRRDGWQVNHKRVERLYRQERLILRLKRRKKRLVVCPVPLPQPEKPNDVWSMDFVHDACMDGRPFRCLTIVDDASRVSPAIEVAHSIPGERVTRVLERLAVTRGLPRVLRIDNGLKFRGAALGAWAKRRGVLLHFTTPGRPMENGFVESFNDKFRQECLNDHWFVSLAHAAREIEKWRHEYNGLRPHSSLGGIPPREAEQRMLKRETDRKHQLIAGTN
jgi:putative transposase